MKVKFRIHKIVFDKIKLFYIQKKGLFGWKNMDYIPDGGNNMVWTYNKPFKETDLYFDAWKTKIEALEFLKKYYNRK
jgi:hypothetical protein